MSFFELAPRNKAEALVEQGRLTYFIVHTRGQRTFGGLTDPHLLFYLMDTQADPAVMTRIRHKLAHWMWSRRFGEAPRLLQEGVAVFAEHASDPNDGGAGRAALKRRIEAAPSIRHLLDNDYFWGYDDAYRVAGSWVAFLAQRWGWTPLKELFLRTDYEDAGVANTFEDVYGVSVESAEAEWRSWIG